VVVSGSHEDLQEFEVRVLSPIILIMKGQVPQNSGIVDELYVGKRIQRQR